MTTTGTTTTGPASGTASGLRERKKAATRLALHEAAVRLAAEHGFDHVTVEAIADATGVSRRTFSNYFGSKEEALLYGDDVRLRSLLDLLRTRPADEPSWAALRASFHELRRREENDLREQWSDQAKQLRKHPSVLAQRMAMYAAFERELAAVIAMREGPGLYPRVLAAAFVTALRVAAQVWAESDQAGSPLDLVDDAFDQFARPFS